MAEKDGKTEKPTPKKLQDARKKGQVPKSQDLSSALSFVSFALAFTALSTYVFQRTFVFLHNMLKLGFSVDNIQNELGSIGITSMMYLIVISAPFLIIAFITGVVGNLVQVGFMFSGEALKPSLKKINPISGFKNIFGKKAVFGLIKNLSKLFIVVGFTLLTLKDSAVLIMNSGNIGTPRIFTFMIGTVSRLCFILAIFLAILGVGDYIFQRYTHKKELMMSMQEIKDEYKEMEGDPQVKAQRKARYRELLSGKISDVDEATVIITNPTHFAIAIRYDQSKDEVPVVLAKGQDIMAQRMKERAKEKEVPMIENRPLARALYKDVEAGSPVPMELYQAIAEILALIFQAEKMKKHKI
ncbi:flagellar biosynthesis protein FlhB [Marinilactibacillus kalidii]|uniref:flagellar biosynthesis protein FlhB n=1 Tax=Marinilactibacillus kalidii TaxID=2820274 RepID=UPI001ABDA1E0|nr:flagellar biosynthesis protein FlhB [Marinilactibacillus kalidii]